MEQALLLYFGGLINGALVMWWLGRSQLQQQTSVDLAHETVMQATFIRATSDVVDKETGNEIKARANELLDEYELPRKGEWNFDP